MPEQVNYYFGRLNLIASYEDKSQFLLRGLQSARWVEHRNMIWDFLEIGKIQTENGLFLHGYLVKYRPSTEAEIAQPITGKIGSTDINDLIVAKSRFFLHTQSGLIAFHPIRGRIEIHQFCKLFCELFEVAFDNFFVDAEIQIIQEQYKIFEVLEQFGSIDRAEIYLHPANPNLNPVWQGVQARLETLGASKYGETYEAGGKSTTLRIVDDEEVRSKIAMAEDGYGEASVTGKLNGEVKKVSTKDNPVSALAPADDTTPEAILDALLVTFKKILGRFRE
jgi:hypothetical protein